MQVGIQQGELFSSFFLTGCPEGYIPLDPEVHINFQQMPTPQEGSEATVGSDVFRDLLVVVDQFARYVMELKGKVSVPESL